MEIEYASSTGRSGVNLDTAGYQIGTQQVVAWVLDGVSPIYYRESDGEGLFRSFQEATVQLNEAFKESEWKDLISGLRVAKSRILESDARKLFTERPFHQTPLFSCGLVKILDNSDVVNVEIVIYGDCVVVIAADNEISTYEFVGLERLKGVLNRIFRFLNLLLPDRLHTMALKARFTIIRFLQVKYGMVRVFSVNDDREPALHESIRLAHDKNIAIYIFSDGISWYFKNSANRLKDIVEFARSSSAETVVRLVRCNEASNHDSGRLDDATLLLVRR